MKIEILGCNGAVAKGFNTTSILVNREVLIDAGSAASELEASSIGRIRHILLTHAHIDHIKELPFILDISCSKDGPGIDIWGSRITIDALKNHLFNGLLWPGLEQLHLNAKKCRLNVLPAGWLELGRVKAMSIEAIHSPGACSFVVSENNKYVIFSGDTSYNPELFSLAESLKENLKLFFVEASFPDRMHNIAELSGHLTPSIIASEIKRLGGSRIIVYHIKPRFFDEVAAEMTGGMEFIRGGEVFEI